MVSGEFSLRLCGFASKISRKGAKRKPQLFLSFIPSPQPITKTASFPLSH
jgi:hypothetical protein